MVDFTLTRMGNDIKSVAAEASAPDWIQPLIATLR